jgi:hypothetical protein
MKKEKFHSKMIFFGMEWKNNSIKFKRICKL